MTEYGAAFGVEIGNDLGANDPRIAIVASAARLVRR